MIVIRPVICTTVASGLIRPRGRTGWIVSISGVHSGPWSLSLSGVHRRVRSWSWYVRGPGVVVSGTLLLLLLLAMCLMSLSVLVLPVISSGRHGQISAKSGFRAQLSSAEAPLA